MTERNYNEYLIDFGPFVGPKYKFPNGYGASVICQPGSYGFEEGLSELAVLKFHGDRDCSLVYDTPITNDVLGFLNEDQVDEVLAAIARLDKDGRLKEDDPWFSTDWA